MILGPIDKGYVTIESDENGGIRVLVRAERDSPEFFASYHNTKILVDDRVTFTRTSTDSSDSDERVSVSYGDSHASIVPLQS